MLKIDTKYLLLLLLLPCWWLFQEVEVIHWTWCRVKIIEKKTQWVENLKFRWRDLTLGFPCPPASTRSRQRTSRKSASIIVKMELMARMVIDVEDMVDPLDFVFKVEVMVKIVKLWPGWFWRQIMMKILVEMNVIFLQVQFSNWDTFISFSLASYYWRQVRLFQLKFWYNFEVQGDCEPGIWGAWNWTKRPSTVCWKA